MGKLNLEIVQKRPQLAVYAELLIEPLAPLSMISELPGSYYKTLKIPNKKMICGLLENIIGWHFDLPDRIKISKDIKLLHKQWAKQQEKQNSINEPIIPYTNYTKGSTYMPLLMDYFEIQNIKPVFSKAVFYDDLWKRSYRRADSADIHMGGSSNLSYEIIAKVHQLKNEINDLTKRIKEETDKERKKDLEKQKEERKEKKNLFFKNHLELFPLYYSTPTKREYIAMEGKYRVELALDTELYNKLKENIQMNNICYLGNSEGWVDLILKKR